MVGQPASPQAGAGWHATYAGILDSLAERRKLYGATLPASGRDRMKMTGHPRRWPVGRGGQRGACQASFNLTKTRGAR